MSAKTKVAAVAVVLLLAGAGIWGVSGLNAPPSRSAVRPARSRAAPLAPLQETREAGTAGLAAGRSFEPPSQVNEREPAWSGGEIRGRVITEDGEPMPKGATLSLLGSVAKLPWENPQTIVPGPDGRFRVVALAQGAYSLTASAKGYAPEHAGPWQVAPGRASYDVTIVLPRGARLSVRVADTAGRAREKFVVSIQGSQRSLGGNLDGEVPFWSTSTDGEGRAGFVHLGDGIYQFSFYLAGTELAWQIGVKRNQKIDVELLTDAKLVGHVVDQVGHPVSDAMVQIYTGSLSASTRTDARGDYTIPALGRGRYRVTVSGPGFAADGGRVELTGRATSEHPVAFGPPFAKGRVRAPKDARVQVMLSGPSWLGAQPQPGGRFAFWNVRPGRYRIKASALGRSGFAQPVKEFDIGATGIDHIEFVIDEQRYGFVELAVRAADGTLPESLQFYISDGIVSTSFAPKSFAPGLFRFRLPVGRRKITAQASLQQRADFWVEVIEGRTTRASAQLSGKTRTGDHGSR